MKLKLLITLSVLLFTTLSTHASIKVKKVTASSVYPSDGSSYYPKYAIDRNSKTAWFPKPVNGTSRGAWIKFEFDDVEPISQIKLINGWTKSRGLYYHNSRVRKTTLTFSNGNTLQVYLDDTMDVQSFDIPTQNTRWVKLSIDAIYVGRAKEAGLTQVSFYIDPAISKARLAAQKKKAREEERKRIAAANAAKAKYLNTLEKEFTTLLANDSQQLIAKLETHYQKPKYSEVKTMARDYFPQAINNTASNMSSSTEVLALWKNIKGNALAKTNLNSLHDVLAIALKKATTEANKSATSDAYINTYNLYHPILAKESKGQLNDLIVKALAYDKKSIETQSDLTHWKTQLKKYQPILSSEQIKAEYITLADKLVKKHISSATTPEQITKINKALMALPLSANQQSEISTKLLEKLGITLRYTFREGKIGKRYVNRLNHTQSSNSTRYINGRAINETKFNDYSTGGYDESRYGFTSVYQMYNESASNYILKLAVSATKKMSEYRKKSSWSGEDSRYKVNKKTHMSQVTTYLLKANSELKDQIVVGENKPEDFTITVLDIIPVVPDWIDNLAKAQDGDDIAITQRYLSDKKALNWRANIGENFAKLAYMNMDIALLTSDKFDKDFDSTVTVKVKNTNQMPIWLEFTSSFNNRESSMTIPANGEKTLQLPAKGKRKRDLEIYIDMLAPAK